MSRLYYLAIDMIAPLLFLPAGFLLYGKAHGFAAVRTWLYLLFTLYIAGVYHMTGLPDLLYYRLDVSVYLGLLTGILDDAQNSILNVILFLPLGIFLRLLCDRYADWKYTALFALGMSLVIELMQMFTLRTTDINDLLTNAAGAVLGTLAANALVRARPGLAIHGTRKDVFFPLATAFLVMFLIQPFFFRVLWNPDLYYSNP
ncbi:MAG: VanZ family protein [Lachnospiraceae bacterium]|nr:VanZ family protein [Lachnospiraceae bacterium]